MKSWMKISADSDFSIYNIPFGIFSFDRGSKRIGVAIGDQVLDLLKSNTTGVLNLGISNEVFENEYLNEFIDVKLF